MWVKICANTNLADARLAADYGADALGFVLAPSRRRVTPAEVAAITPLLPSHVERIGVFTGGSPEEIAAAATYAGLTGVQLHGDFAAQFLPKFRAVAGDRFTIIRTIHWIVDRDRAGVSAAAPSGGAELLTQICSSSITASVDRLLLDSRINGESGGTGVSFPWTEAAAALDPVRGEQRLIVAGGLRPDTVAEAIQILKPYGVDVASGVESEPGKKDPQLLRTFLEQARL